MSPSVLLVEDEMLLASDAEYLLEQYGAKPVGPAVRADEAIALAEKTKPDFAIVDMHLLDGPTGVQVAQHLTQKLGIPVIFATGNVGRVPEDFAGACAVLEKPYSDNGFLAAVSFMCQCLRKPPEEAVKKPAPLTLAPWFKRQLEKGVHWPVSKLSAF